MNNWISRFVLLVCALMLNQQKSELEKIRKDGKLLLANSTALSNWSHSIGLLHMTYIKLTGACAQQSFSASTPNR